MLKIELIRFEAQDVITASGVVKHSALCTAAMTGGKDDGRDTHDPGMNGYPNAIWLQNGGWRDCDCDCHK